MLMYLTHLEDYFSPDYLEIKSGDTIEWVWSDDNHIDNVTVISAPPGINRFDYATANSPSRNYRWSRRLDKPGTSVFEESLHHFMRMAVKVGKRDELMSFDSFSRRGFLSMAGGVLICTIGNKQFKIDQSTDFNALAKEVPVPPKVAAKNDPQISKASISVPARSTGSRRNRSPGTSCPSAVTRCSGSRSPRRSA